MEFARVKIVAKDHLFIKFLNKAISWKFVSKRKGSTNST